MNKNYLFILGIAAVVFLGAVLLFSNSPEAQQASVLGALENLEFGEGSFDFGSISMKEGNVSHEFVVKNTGAQAVSISRVYTSCMCTTAKIRIGEYQSGFFGMAGHGYIPKLNKVVEPGEEAVVEVVFDPAAHGPPGVGRVERAVYLEGKDGEKTTLEITATVTP